MLHYSEKIFRGYKPKYQGSWCYQRLYGNKLSFTNLFTASNARSNVRVSYLGLIKEVANRGLRLGGFKSKNMLCRVCLKVKNKK